MKRIVARLGVVALCCLFIPTLTADEKQDAKKKRQRAGNATVNQLTKKLEVIELTAEQKEKLAELGKELQALIKPLRQEGFTQQLNKRRTEAMKAAREAGKKGPELAAAVKETFTAEENELIAKAQAANTKFREKVFAMLTDEQKEKLPQALKRQLAPKKANAKRPNANKS